MKRRVIRLTLLVGLLGLAGALAWAFVDHCGTWAPEPPRLEQTVRAHGPLLVGAARVALQLPLPIQRGGYPWPHPSVAEVNPPMHVRALMFSVAGQRVGLLVFDTLLMSTPLAQAVSDARGYPVLAVATHTHSGPGQFDDRLVVQVAALGARRDDVFDALVTAGRQALDEASQNLGPASMQRVDRESDAFGRPRSGASVDPHLTRLQFSREGAPFAELFVVSAHPTYVLRGEAVLNGDYPAAIDDDPRVVRLVVQSSAGNASAATETIETQAALLRSIFEGTPAVKSDDQAEVELGYARVSLGLPVPDSSRVGPFFTRTPVRNALCAGAERQTHVSALHIGGFSLLALPVEPSWSAGQQLLAASHASRVMALTDGYAGYVEPEVMVLKREGEAKRQVFGPQLLGLLQQASTVATQAAGITAP